MNVVHPGLLARRFAAGFIDVALEVGSGFLGSYFGAMVAALAVAMTNESPEAMQLSIWHGFGFGFVFWSLSISFLNRVLIQGVSRASIGKKVFRLEIISCHQPLTWGVMTKRWVLSILSTALGGLGYSVMFFNPEGKAMHDFLTDTDVIPTFAGRNMSVDHHEQEMFAHQALSPTFSEQFASRVLVMANSYAERPMANLIPMPVKPATEITQPNIVVPVSPAASLAEVIQLRPRADKDAVAANTVDIQIAEQDDSKKVA